MVSKLEKPNRTVMLEGRLTVLQHKILNGIFHVLRGRLSDQFCDDISLRETIDIPYEWVTDSELEGGKSRVAFERAGKEIFKTVFEEKKLYEFARDGSVLIENYKTFFHAIDSMSYVWDRRVFRIKLGGYFVDRCKAIFLTSGFVTLPLADVIPLESVYSLRFYELLKQYSEVGRGEVEKPVSWLRSWLDLGKKYSEFDNFRRRVLEQAHREINEKTNLRYEFELIKRGRVVDSVRFFGISYSSSLPVNVAQVEPVALEYSEIEKLLISAGVDGSAVQHIEQLYPDPAFIRSLIQQSAKTKSPAGFIVAKAGEKWREWEIKRNSKTAPKTALKPSTHNRTPEKIENDRKQAEIAQKRALEYDSLPETVKNVVRSYKKSPEGGGVLFLSDPQVYATIADRLILDPLTGLCAIQQDFTEISTRGMGKK